MRSGPVLRLALCVACTSMIASGTAEELRRLASSDEIVFIDGTAHCRDMYTPGAFEHLNITDSASVKWAHAKITAAVAGFVSESVRQ